MSPARAAQAAVVGIAITDRFELFVDTLAATRKVHNLRRNPRIAFVIGELTSGDERTVQDEGVADEPAGTDLARLKGAVFRRLPRRSRAPVLAGITYVRVHPTWIRYSDFNRAPPQIGEFAPHQLDMGG